MSALARTDIGRAPVPAPSSLRTVARPRLLQRLDEGENARLTVVVAAPGFGKTVLLGQWLAEHPHRPVAWIDLHAWHDDELRYWSDVVDSLDRLQPGALAPARRLLRRSADPGADPDFLTALAAAAARLPQGTVLVISDFHVITRPGISAAMAALIDLLPPAFRLIISSRSEPALGLHRLRADEQLVEIRQSDLRFDLDESAELVELVLGRHLDVRDVALIQGRTEGWATGLHLAALSLRRRADPGEFLRRLAGSDQMVADYLIAEVLDRQPSAVRRFLLGTSILDSMCAELCDAVLETDDSAAMLRALTAANLFIVPVDDAHRWYRYHHMFRDMLQQQLRLDAGQWATVLHRNAAAWYRRRGEPGPAVAHLLAAGETEAAFDVVDEQIEACADPPGEFARGVYLDAAPEEFIGADPARMVTYALILLGDGRADLALSWLRQAETQLGPAARDSDVSRRLHRAWLLFYEMRGDATHVLREATSLLRAADAAADDAMAVRAVAALMRAHTWRENFGAARLVHSWGLEQVSGRPSRLRRVVLPGVLAHVAAAEGNLREAEGLISQALGGEVHQMWKAEDLMDPWLARAIVLRERASLDHADVVLRHLLELAERTRHMAFIVETQVQLSRLRFAQGRGGEALDGLAAARRQQAFAATPQHLLARIHALEGRYWVAAGDLNRARQLLSLLPDSVPAALLVARIAVAEHEPRRALDRLSRIDPDRLHRASAIDLAMLAARAWIPIDLREAERWMRKALDLGRPEHFLQSFLDEGEDVIRLLRRLAATDPSPYLRDLVAAGAHLVAAPPPSPPELFEPLSHRERAVLRLLPSQLSNQEIAGELHVSLNTLKTHLKSIYRKLEAGSRSQAVARARGLKVI